MAPRLFACFGGKRAEKPTGTAATKSSATSVSDTTAAEGPVIIELFSSQGCTTSPAAEMLLSRLGRGDFRQQIDFPVIILGFHVDYFDYMGWKDPYGSSQWTVRQKAYVEALKLDELFTPQVVVQGRSQCVGNEEDVFFKTIRDAPRFPAPKFQATFEQPTPETLKVTLTGSLRTKVDSSGVNIMVALYESGLVNDCPAGENKGRVLSNDFVVRKLEKLCTTKDTSAKKTITGTVNFTLWQGFSSSKCSLAVFAQNSSHQIFGSQNIKLPNEITI